MTLVVSLRDTHLHTVSLNQEGGYPVCTDVTEPKAVRSLRGWNSWLLEPGFKSRLCNSPCPGAFVCSRLSRPTQEDPKIQNNPHSKIPYGPTERLEVTHHRRPRPFTGGVSGVGTSPNPETKEMGWSGEEAVVVCHRAPSHCACSWLPGWHWPRARPLSHQL